MMKQITAKLGNMRKAAKWTIYPKSYSEHRDNIFTIQSPTRIATVNVGTRKGVLSVARPSGAYFIHLNTQLGATSIDVPQDVCDAIVASQPKSGDSIGGGVVIG